MNAYEVFQAALEKATLAQRAAYLDDVCAHDPELRAKVEGLVQSHEQAGSFLQLPLFANLATISQPLSESPGTIIGRYKLLQQIGQGGMGVVYMAEQTEPVERRVALKIIKPGMDTGQVIARFEAERQALAMMDHPNIAKVLDAGTTDSGRPYFVMELVKGLPITEYCDEEQLTPRERLELFLPICQAVQHAHQKGIIHRDLKPSNILVARYDDKAVPKIIDFGIAKAVSQRLTERTMFTQYGQIVGTIEYMSPEQAQFNQIDVDTRSDIYSLGVLLYDLLTGETPFDKQRLRTAAFDEMLRIIREEEPPRPSTRLSGNETLPSIAANRQTEPKKLTTLVRGELDWIVMKALEKDRGRRYETASAFAADVQRYLDDEPVQAGRPSALYRLRKFARRNRAVLTVAAVILTAGLALGWSIWDRAALVEHAENIEARRRSESVRLITAALHETDLLRAAAQAKADDLLAWSAALTEARRAQSLAAAGPSAADLRAAVAARLVELQREHDAVRARLVQAERDQRMLAALDEAQLAGAALKDGHFDPTRTDAAYLLAFQEYGIDVRALSVSRSASLIRASSIRAELVKALLDWLYIAPEEEDAARGPARTKLQAVAEAAVDELPSWHHDFLRCSREPEGDAVDRLLAKSDDLPPQAIVRLARAMDRDARDGLEPVIGLLRRAQRRYPGDFWLNHDLGVVLRDTPSADPKRAADAVRFLAIAVTLRPTSPGAWLNFGRALDTAGREDEAIAAYSRALELRPDYSEAHNNIGIALREYGDLDGAIAAFRRALLLKPDDPEAHNNLGLALYDSGDLQAAIGACRRALELKPDLPEAYNNLGLALHESGDFQGAIAACRRALELRPDLPEAHFNLGYALQKSGDLKQAIAAYHRGLELKPDDPATHYNLGNSLSDCGDFKGAIAAYRRAVELKPDLPEAHCNLGLAALRSGDFAAGLAALRRGHELGSRDPKWRYPSAEWVHKGERLVELDDRLTRFDSGAWQPADAAERVELARFALGHKHVPLTAALLFRDALAEDPAVGDDPATGHRYNAACAAALASAADALPELPLSASDRAAWRAQAHDWLTAELAAWQSLADANFSTRPAIAQTLARWRSDPHLAPVRDPDPLARLPESEQQQWHALWKRVEQLRASLTPAATGSGCCTSAAAGTAGYLSSTTQPRTTTPSKSDHHLTRWRAAHPETLVYTGEPRDS